MKKLILLFSLILVSQSAFAYIDNQFMTTEQYLVNTGYSAEAAKMMTITNQDPYREVHKEGKDIKSILRRAYHYIAPVNEADLDFYNHSGSYNGPSWKDF